MGRFVFVAVLLTMASAIQATTGSTASATTTEAAAPAPDATARTADSDKPKRVCRARAATGSIMRGRVCRTASDDEQSAESTRNHQAHNDGAAGADQTSAR